MTETRAIATVYAAGVAQGVALVTFPAASAIFTSPQAYGLTSTQYGAMFLPQALTAIAASLMGAGLTRRIGVKRLYLLGLAADMAAMSLLVASQFAVSNHTLAYVILLLATAALGIGFGLTVPALNTLVASLLPQKVDQGVLILNALLGLGTALAPLFVTLFVGLGFWWGLPVAVTVALFVILLFSLPQTLASAQPDAAPSATAASRGIPARFWVFAGFALLYGIIETLNGNWATIYMTQELGASASLGALALTVFWGSVTGGRVLFAATARWLSERTVYRLLPFAAALAFVLIAWLPSARQPVAGLAAFGLAGLGCSALLPLTISFGQVGLVTMSAAAASALIAFYQIGYGIAAFGVGPLEERAGLSMSTIYLLGAGVSLLLAVVGMVIVHQQKKVAA